MPGSRLPDASRSAPQYPPQTKAVPSIPRAYEDVANNGVALASAEDAVVWLAARFACEEVDETGCG